MVLSRNAKLAFLMGCTGLVSPALAQTAPATDGALNAPASASRPAARTDSHLEEIVVTAQRTSQSLQRVPIAVTAVSGTQLQQRGVTDTASLAQVVPGLSFNQTGSELNPFLRGVGTSGGNPNDEQSVATYVDGVYIASPVGNEYNLNNVDRIEVLKGPQGTLFGRNATGGLIQIITRDPSFTPSGNVSVGFGTYDSLQTSGYATAGISRTVAVNLAVDYTNNFSGYGRDIYRDQRILQYGHLDTRTKLLWLPTASTKVIVALDYGKGDSTGSDYQLAQGVIGANGVTSFPGAYKTDSNYRNSDHNAVYGASVRVEQDLGFARLVDITAFRKVAGNLHLDQDDTPTNLIASVLNQFAQTFSQEVQLLSPKGDSKLTWSLGGYYFNGQYRYDPLTVAGLGAVASFGVPSVGIFGAEYTQSEAAYGQATYEILPGTKFTAGLRITHETQNVDASILLPGITTVGFAPQSQSSNKLTWRFALDHQFSQNILGYVSYNRGVKSGGFNLLGPGQPGYRPEVLDAFEIGFKTELFDRHVRINTAGFYYSYSNIQVQNLLQGGALDTVNAASATVKGFDGDAAWLVSENLTLNGGVSYVDGEYDSFPNAVFTPASPFDGPQTIGDASGHRIIDAPRWTADAGIAYTLPVGPGSMKANADISYRTKAFVTADNRLIIPGYAVANGTLSWTPNSNKYTLSIFGRNLFNKKYYASRLEQGLGDTQYLAPPGVYGGAVSVNF